MRAVLLGGGSRSWQWQGMAQDLESAFDRLDQAIRTIEADSGQRVALLEERERLYAEVARLSTDRAQLAQLLDAARAEARTLEEANQAVSQHLTDVMETVRAVLAGDTPPQSPVVPG